MLELLLAALMPAKALSLSLASSHMIRKVKDLLNSCTVSAHLVAILAVQRDHLIQQHILVLLFHDSVG